MARSLDSVATAQEPALTFVECFNALLRAPDLAAYVIGVGDGGEFTFEDANEFVAQIAGKPLSEIRGRTIEQVLPLELADCLTTHLRTAIENGEPLAYQRTLDLPGGRVSFKTSLVPVMRGSRGTKYVLGLTRDASHEIDLLEHAQHQAELLRTLGIALPSAVYVLDLDTRALKFVGGEASPSQLEWRKGAEGGGPDVGEKYFHPEDWPRAQAHWQELAALKDGEVSTISYRLLAKGGEFSRHVHREVVLKRDADGNVRLVLGIAENVSDQDKVEQEARDLSAHMLTLQIEERGRIAQELHDSTGQHLVAAGLALHNLRAFQDGGGSAIDARAAIDDAVQCVRQAQHEIRVLSYLLHPPELRSGGLAEAIETFACGFGRRAGLRVELALSPRVEEIDDDIALHLFRVSQEALTNVYRHADARTVSLKLELDSMIRLTVKDDGVGFNGSKPKILGVGLPGMHRRMTRLGGDMTISGDPGGTTLIATIPLTMQNGNRRLAAPSAGT
jgi:two-component system, NarL family, sensor kinase